MAPPGSRCGSERTLARSILMFTATDGWAFALVGPPFCIYEPIVVNLVQRYHNGRWETTPWPFVDIGYFQIFRVSDSEAWAIGDKLDQSSSDLVLFHFASGVWTQYGG